MSNINQRKSIGNYTEYLKQKSMANNSNDQNLNYMLCFNKAIALINNGDPVSGVALLRELYSIKKDPDVFKLINDNKGSCT